MRLGVNTRLLLDGKLEGIGYFALQLLNRMAVSHPEDEFVFFFDRKYSRKFVFSKNVKPVVIPLPTRHPVLWKVYFDYLLPVYCHLYNIDVFFSPENYIPRVKSIPTICTIHDLNFMYNKKYIGSSSHQKYFMKYFPKNALECKKIVTVSEFSKKDIVNKMEVPTGKVHVVYNAANPLYEPKSEQDNQKTKDKYTQGKDFFYFVGAIHKRKNLVGIFEAFDLFKKATHSDVKLVVVGNKKWWEEDIAKAYESMQYKEDVVFTGRMEVEQLAYVVSASLGLVFPSFFEGFGIPVVEAFQSHTPVITSNTTSLPEVAGDAALLVDPHNSQEIADAMKTLYQDKEIKQNLINKGIEQNKLFSWEESSEKLWKIIKSCKK